MSVDIGERIRSLRTARGLSQEEVARRTRIGLKSYGDLERGRTKDPHYSTLRGVARALGVRVEELIEEPAVPLDEAPDTGYSVDSTEEVITFDDEAVRAAITAAKAGKLTTKEAARAIADSVRGGPVDALEDAVELLLEHAEASREEVEA